MRIIENDQFDWNNRVYQLRAMIGHDIAKNQGGSLQNAAKQIRAKMLIIVGGTGSYGQSVARNKNGGVFKCSVTDIKNRLWPRRAGLRTGKNYCQPYNSF
ncbi:MAG: hypothetical protein WDM78_02125 [Puia sp.]